MIEPQQLGHYRILQEIGRGATGAVYRARDVRLRRDVAIKLLSEIHASNPEWQGRFEREARILASLNHPNIAAIHGIEESEYGRFLVLEFVAGETISERLTHGTLCIEDALMLSLQTAKALEAAHRQGIIHRDLKPANVMVTSEGEIKVLDFGLARTVRAELSTTSTDSTISIQTQSGTILGTPAYMSPEQARGETVDSRTDNWSFGCLLYEMLVGRPLFTGATVADVSVSILTHEPDLQLLPKSLPRGISVSLIRCLRKKPDQRLQHIGDFRIEIEECIAALREARSGSKVGHHTGVAHPDPQGSHARTPVTRVVVPVPTSDTLPGLNFPVVAMSPDGARLVYSAVRDGKRQLFRRDMNSLDAEPIPDTNGGYGPFFSPDGQWVGFYAHRKLRKVPTTGGHALTICDAPTALGACWMGDNSIVFTPAIPSGLSRVSADGGVPQIVTTPESRQQELSHLWPEILPDRKSMLLTIWKSSIDTALIAVLSLETGDYRVLLEHATCPKYAPTGHIVFAQAGSLLAVPFDAGNLQLSGSPVPMVENVCTHPATGVAQFGLSTTGSLVYVPGGAQAIEGQVVWLDGRGSPRPLLDDRRALEPSLSPDGTRLALTMTEGGNYDIWVNDLDRGTLIRLTTNGSSSNPIWTPDCAHVTYSISQGDKCKIVSTPADGSGGEEVLQSSSYELAPTSWSPDGKFLAYTEFHHVTGADIWVLSREQEATPFVCTQYAEGGAVFSPDGRWLSYASNESGRFEVYVRSFPTPGAKHQISIDGGVEPRWSTKKELFYRRGDRLMVVDREEGQSGSSRPRQLLEGQFLRRTWTSYDVANDGRRFVAIQRIEAVEPKQFNLILGWFEELSRKV